MNIWNEKDLIIKIKNVMHYIHFTPFLKGKQKYYYIILIIYICILVIILGLFLIMSIRLKSKRYNILWPIYILKYCLPILFISFFGQTFY